MSGAGVASIGADCCLTPSENAKWSPSEFGVGSHCDMGRIPGICEQVEGLLRDEMWGLDGYWSAIGQLVLGGVSGPCGV